MEIGLFHQMWASPEIDDKEFFAQTVEDVQLADTLGFESCSFGEHHFVRAKAFYGRLPVPEVLIAKLAAETTRIKLGTAIKILTLDNPLRFAEAVSLLDLLTEGRVMFGLGHGSPADMEHMGLTQAEKHQQFRNILLELLDYLSLNRQGPQITPQPRQGMHQLFWLGVRDRNTIVLGAQLGLNLLIGQGEDATAQNTYTDLYREAGGKGFVRGFRLVYVGETDAEARKTVDEAARMFFSVREKLPQYLNAQRQGRIPYEPPKDLPDLLGRIEYIVGSPTTVAEQLERYISQTKIDYLGVKMHVPGLLNEDVRRSMRLFAQEVAPKVQLAKKLEVISV
ncbi:MULTISPECIES: LLM class flavin-dependent oxidoreductase [Nostocales]|uniref:LLM class flavin-dependent oxidoreductase n=3 Tax=Nostocales TaxID=1161 RepID=A0A0C1N3F2_9CYAN|nr:LLM class flavin-dependent oxidoreductase [Tolypothrix bouteillei]KAF3885194.1 LLM class flavin-dependent oxidoreductase [Tolypothrix bouteillei VB521301]